MQWATACSPGRVREPWCQRALNPSRTNRPQARMAGDSEIACYRSVYCEQPRCRPLRGLGMAGAPPPRAARTLPWATWSPATRAVLSKPLHGTSPGGRISGAAGLHVLVLIPAVAWYINPARFKHRPGTVISRAKAATAIPQDPTSNLLTRHRDSQ